MAIFSHCSFCRTGSGDKLERLAPLIVKLGPCLNDQSFFVVDGTVCHRWQAGCLRVNCLDCLDRTNLCQTVVGLKVCVAATGRQASCLFFSSPFFQVLDAMLTYLWKSTDLRDSKLEQFRRVFIVCAMVENETR